MHVKGFPFVWVRTCLVMFALRSLMYLQLPQAQVKRFFCPDFDMSRPPRWTQRVFRLLTPREPLRRARGAEFGRYYGVKVSKSRASDVRRSVRAEPRVGVEPVVSNASALGRQVNFRVLNGSALDLVPRG